MERGKKVVRRDRRKLIFCIIVTLLFGRAVTFCQGPDEFESSYFEIDQSVAKIQLPEDFTIEVLEKHDVIFPSTLGKAEPDSLRPIPVPPVGVTLVAFASAAIVGWLRRRTPS